MPIFHQSSSSTTNTPYMLSIKILLISTTIISISIIALKLPITDISITPPSFYDKLVSWLKPPYLYLVFNFIIITIFASSKLQSKFQQEPSPALVHEPRDRSSTQIQDVRNYVKNVQIPTTDFSMPEAPILQVEDVLTMTSPLQVGEPILKTVQMEDVFNMAAPPQPVTAVTSPSLIGEVFAYSENSYVDVRKVEDFVNVDDIVAETETETGTGTETEFIAAAEEEIDMNRSKEFVISKTAWETPVGKEYSVRSAEKPPAATRFGHHRRIVKASPEGGKTALRVSKPRRQDTLESTWKMITEGRSIPLARHLKKSDTWETHGHNVDNEVQKMVKTETFREQSETMTQPLRRTRTPGKLKKEPSLGQDELNKRVEAFIKKFNEEMRLQRQESLNQYMEMMNRGAH